MRILCTFPGRHGDLLWALPTVRAIAEATDGPVDLQIAGEFAALGPLLGDQPYLGEIIADPDWTLADWEAGGGLEPAGQAPPLLPPINQDPYDHVIPLGYRRWPTLPLPYEIFNNAVERAPLPLLPAIDLSRPWIEAIPWVDHATPLVIGFSDYHFELKVGLLALLQDRPLPPEALTREAFVLAAPGSRWVSEGGYSPIAWLEAAQRITGATAVLADCSALHVLAVACGTPAILVEPMEARWNGIFYPCGWDGPQVTVVKGLDGRPTFDARHLAEIVERILEAF